MVTRIPKIHGRTLLAMAKSVLPLTFMNFCSLVILLFAPNYILMSPKNSNSVVG